MLAMEQSCGSGVAENSSTSEPNQSIDNPATILSPQQQPAQHVVNMARQPSFERNNSTLEERSIISSLFNEICIEAEAFHMPPILPPDAAKKLKKRKSELALDMTPDEIDSILGDGSANNGANFNPHNPFGPSPSGVTNGFGEIHSPPQQQKASPPLTKYAQNNQGQRNSPQQQQQQQQQHSAYPMSSQFHQMNSPMHSPAPLIMHHPLHHNRLLQHQQSAPNLRTTFDDLPMPTTLNPIPGTKPFDKTLVDEFKMCVSVILMASDRAQCRNVYRQLTAEVSELYSRVVKNQVPKKAVKKIVATRSICTVNEKYELERQFKCLSDGLASRQSTQLYESIVNFLYKMRIAIPDL